MFTTGFIDNLLLLGISGVGGAYCRAIIWPEPDWIKRIMQAIAGAVSAVCLGALLAVAIDKIVGAGPYAYLAGGFLTGVSGELGIKYWQNKMLGRSDGHDADSK